MGKWGSKNVNYVSKRGTFFGNTLCLPNSRESASVSATQLETFGLKKFWPHENIA
jgi:hypothetical protein